jgi:GT2 family glycosyltransferase
METPMSPEPADPPVSIIIPTHNRLRLLQECLGRAMVAGWPAKVVIVDDASDDGTAEWSSTLTDPRVTVVPLTSRVGAALARNHGLDRVETPFVLFLDDDDLLITSGIGTLVAALHAAPNAVAAIGQGVEFDEDGDRTDRLGPARADRRTVFAEVLAGWCPQVAQAVFRTDVVRQVGGWTANLDPCDDYDLWLRVAACGPVALEPVVTVEVRVHSQQTSWSPDDTRCTARNLSLAAARRARHPVTTGRVHAAAWNRHMAQRFEGRGHRLAAVTCYLSALALAPELRRSVVMGPELRLGLQRSVQGLRWWPRRPGASDKVARSADR